MFRFSLGIIISTWKGSQWKQANPQNGKLKSFSSSQSSREKRATLPREIAGHFEVSIPTVHQHITYLHKKNLLARKKGRRRTIQAFNDQNGDLVEIPLMGLIAAGGPIEAVRNPESIEVPRSMLSRGANHYALKVTGTSMIEEGISDGDIVIVREQQTVDDGEKAVAYLPDQDAVTLKKIYREKNRIKLVPANKTMEPFYEKNVEVQGKVIGVIRKEI